MLRFEEITRPTTTPRRIRDVAGGWGFENPSHFNRLFKSRFGLPPSEVLGASRPPTVEAAHPGATDWIRETHAWTRSL